MHVLIVDSELGYRSILESYFRTEGWNVTAVPEAMSGLEQLSARRIDSIVSGVRLPLIDGATFHKQVREQKGFAEIPFVFVSEADNQAVRTTVDGTPHAAFVNRMQPLSLVKEWIEYLSMPVAQRSSTAPQGYRSPELSPAQRKTYSLLGLWLASDAAWDSKRPFRA